MKPLLIAVLAMLAVTAPAETYLRDATPEELRDGRIKVNMDFMLCIGGTNQTGTMILRSDNKWYVKTTNWCDRIPASEQEQNVKDLAKGGVICKVLGHQWTHKIGDMVFAHTRICNICGKVETKTEGEWR